MFDVDDEGGVIERFGLPPRAEDLPIIRDELARRARLEHDQQGEGDTLIMKALAVLLFAASHVEDSLHIWRAKRSSFDAACSLDVQLLCGAGYDATLRFLRETDGDDARNALTYIVKCEAAGDFEGHDAPDGRLASMLPSYRRYYQV